ncbi:hypothetical protein HWV62_40322 [Athelia sp. TMB]|nr:hypothetical protein HWV62_40322 [Athelia sp. TMB]
MSDSSLITEETTQPPGKLPGFGLPLNFGPPHYGNDALFRNAIDCQNSHMRLITLRELTMMRLMNQITDKPDWDKKISDKTIVAKWKSEALSATDQEGQHIDITEKMFEYCVSELHYKAGLLAQTDVVVAFDGDIVKSDTIVPEELRLALKSAAASLEDVSPAHQDWHPGSHDTVLDLVHPSLFPVVYGTTRILRHATVVLEECIAQCGNGVTLPVPPEEEAKFGEIASYLARHLQNPYSRKFQWLPCEVAFSGEGDDVRITSYINNLHPKNESLYAVIEKIIGKTIRLWNHSLNPLNDQEINSVRIPFDEPQYGSIDDIPADQRPARRANEHDYNYERRLTELTLVLPEPEPFVEPRFRETMSVVADKRLVKWGIPSPLEIDTASDTPRLKEFLNLGQEYKDRGLQVIVKLANIHLTPERPEYAGGTWHVEGQLNEHICATALYYYDCANITESRLAFRQQSRSPEWRDIRYEQDSHRWLGDVYGFGNEDATVQYIGDVRTQEGRLVTFPNIFQHRVLPFKLADPTQPGHRKILALFLVDPHIRIISSANVPCQRRDWWEEEVERSRALPSKLPLEMKREIMENIEGRDFPMSLEEAKTLRLELMEERKQYGAMQDRQFQNTTFSLCEH